MDRFRDIAKKVAVKLDTRKEVQKYKQEHDARPGTKVQVRTKQEMKKRYHEKVSERVEKIASEIMKLGASMGMVFAIKHVGDTSTEMLLDITNGFIQIGMGGEWWNGQVRPGKTVLHHKKEHADPAYMPVEVVIANRGYDVHVSVTGGFYGDNRYDFVVSAK